MTLLQSLFIAYTYAKITAFKSTSFEGETDHFYKSKLYIPCSLKMIRGGFKYVIHIIFLIFLKIK